MDNDCRSDEFRDRAPFEDDLNADKIVVLVTVTSLSKVATQSCCWHKAASTLSCIQTKWYLNS